MKAMESTEISLSRDELLLINNAINEVLNGPDAIDDAEFQTRLGVERSFATDTLAKVKRLIGQ